MFFELRKYQVWPGKMDEWVKYMEEEIIPFQRAKGMVIFGSFTCPEEENSFIWIRRFESEEEKEALYEAVYQTPEWKDGFAPKVADLIDRSKIEVTIIKSTSRSIMR